MSRHESDEPRDRPEEAARELRRHLPRPSDALVSRIERLAERRSARRDRSRLPWFNRRRIVFALGTALMVAVVGGVVFGELGQPSKSPSAQASRRAGRLEKLLTPTVATSTTQRFGAQLKPSVGAGGVIPATNKTSKSPCGAACQPYVYKTGLQTGLPSAKRKAFLADNFSGSSAAPLTPTKRLAEQRATLIVKVARDELSSTTKKVESITSSLGGYLVSARYSVPKRGTATSRLKLKVPAAEAPEALTRISALGDILSQNVSLVDLQNTVNNESDQINSLKKRIDGLIKALEDPYLTSSARSKLQVELTNDRIQRKALLAKRKANVRSGQMATISLTLRTSDLPQPPDKPSRIHKAIDRAWNGLSSEISWAAIGLIVASPFLVLALIGVPAMRIRRRREEQRLLEK